MPSNLSNLSNIVNVMTNRGISLRALEQLAARGEVDRGLVNKLARADLNQDGSIGSIEELAAALKLIGAEQALKSSLSAPPSQRRNALQRDLRSEMSERTRPTRGMQRPPAGDSGASSVSATRGDASSIQASGTIGRFEGGGPVNVSKDASGKANAVQFKADMDVDTDGGTSALARSDRYYQSQTSMKWANGRSLNSDKLPFVVLPPSVAKATGAKLGDLVEVEQNGKKMYAIYGDNGPSRKIGEASLAVAHAFDAKAGPNRAAQGSFTYTVLPGSGAQAGIRNGGAEKSAAEIQAAGARAFAHARARGVIE